MQNSYDKPTKHSSVDAAEVTGEFPNASAPQRLGKFNPKSRKPLGKLLVDLPRLSAELAKAEVEQVKTEMKAKAIKGGTGAGLFAVVAFFAVTLWAVLITAAILGLNVVFAPWLSALIVVSGLLVLMIIATIVAITLFKKMNGIMPQETIESVKQDLNAVKGMGKYE